MRDRLQELCTTIWALLSDDERGYWTYEEGLYNYVRAVANLANINYEVIDDIDSIVDAVYEEK